ncbi:MAG: hypothetical protein H0T60_02540 [Acidobacteria bacterium]|nr:hypothetical protein [Acidobacteriota bacterium]
MWQFILTDLAYNNLGEIVNASERTATAGINKTSTAAVKLHLDHPLADNVASGDCGLKVYKDGLLRQIGPVVTVQETGNKDGGNLSLNAVDASWFFTKRLVGLSATGIEFAAATDRGQIMKTLIDSTTVAPLPAMPVSTDGYMTAGSTATYTGGPYKTVMECLTELSASYDGFDWQINPTEPSYNSAGHLKIGQIEIRPRIGNDFTAQTVFEFGDGKHNISEYSRTLDRTTQATRVYHISDQGPDIPGGPVKVASDAVAYGQWGLLDDIAQAQLSDETMRQHLVNEHVRVRKNPRQTITFNPHPLKTPDLGVEYDVGDTIRARAIYERSIRFDAMMRIWGVAVSLDDNNKETYTLTLSEEGA